MSTNNAQIIPVKKVAPTKQFNIARFTTHRYEDWEQNNTTLTLRKKTEQDQLEELAANNELEEEKPEKETKKQQYEYRRLQSSEKYILSDGARQFEGSFEEGEDANYVLFVYLQNEFAVIPVNPKWISFKPRLLNAQKEQTGSKTTTATEDAELMMKKQRQKEAKLIATFVKPEPGEDGAPASGSKIRKKRAARAVRKSMDDDGADFARDASDDEGFNEDDDVHRGAEEGLEYDEDDEKFAKRLEGDLDEDNPKNKSNYAKQMEKLLKKQKRGTDEEEEEEKAAKKKAEDEAKAKQKEQKEEEKKKKAAAAAAAAVKKEQKPKPKPLTSDDVLPTPNLSLVQQQTPPKTTTVAPAQDLKRKAPDSSVTPPPPAKKHKPSPAPASSSNAPSTTTATPAKPAATVPIEQSEDQLRKDIIALLREKGKMKSGDIITRFVPKTLPEREKKARYNLVAGVVGSVASLNKQDKTISLKPNIN